MEEEKNNKIKNTALLIPIVSISVFFVLIFGAGYAYFTMNTTAANKTANGNITTPQRPGLECSKTDSAATITIDKMLNATPAKGNIAGTASPKLVCNCTGSGKCGFTVTVAGPTGFTPSPANEVTVALTSSNTTACPANTAHNWAAGTLTTCSLAAGQSVTLTGAINFYNVDGNQDNRAGQTYVFTLNSVAGTFTS